MNGKTVSVKGVWRQAFPTADIFDELVDDTCPDVVIRVVATAFSSASPPPAGHRLNMASARHAQRIAEKALADHRNLFATIVGVLYVQKKDDFVPARPLNQEVTIPPPHKWYPLLLLIESIPEVKER